jgi:hypothetical protein
MAVAPPPARWLLRSVDVRERSIAADVARREARARTAFGGVRQALDAGARVATVRRELRRLRRHD